MKQFFLLLLSCTIFSLLYPRFVSATVMLGEVASSGKTYINYLSNHGYISSEKTELYKYSVKALETMRKKMVAANYISDRYVVIEIPSSVFQLKYNDNYSEVKPVCQLYFGDIKDTYEIQI